MSIQNQSKNRDTQKEKKLSWDPMKESEARKRDLELWVLWGLGWEMALVMDMDMVIVIIIIIIVEFFLVGIRVRECESSNGFT